MDHKIFTNGLKQFTFVLLALSAFNITTCDGFEIKQEVKPLELSNYVTLVITVPETHADLLREAMGRAGAGRVGDYSYCSYSVKGMGRFMPNKGSNPYLGKEGTLEEVVEERIETVCNRKVLDLVLEEIKKAHPYEETVIDIYPIYEIGRKKGKREK